MSDWLRKQWRLGWYMAIVLTLDFILHLVESHAF